MSDPCPMPSQVNIFPERRRKREEEEEKKEEEEENGDNHEISKDAADPSPDSDSGASEHGQKSNQVTDEKGPTQAQDNKKGASHTTTKPSRPRQTLLSFTSQGSLSTRKQLTNPTNRNSASRKPLLDIATETKALLPGLLATRPDVPPKGYLYKPLDTAPLDQLTCPQLPPTRIRVLNSDSLDAALSLSASAPNNRHPCILNMANARSAGGGWEHGALAQEEALCYRTSLSRTLKKQHYPLPDRGGIYSPFVLVIRESMRSGHDLLDLTQPARLPVISVVSVAAVCLPPVTTDAGGVERYALGQDRRLMEEKMRVVLRIAAKNGNRQLVLGAFGCGAFANPRQEVARMWASVLKEPEFVGGWWSDVVFAVLDDGRGNLQTFKKELDGLTV